jgi:hypothetical protein
VADTLSYRSATGQVPEQMSREHRNDKLYQSCYKSYQRGLRITSKLTSLDGSAVSYSNILENADLVRRWISRISTLDSTPLRMPCCVIPWGRKLMPVLRDTERMI